MIELGFMTESGRKAFEEGTKGKERIPSSKSFSVPPYLKAALSKNKGAWNTFQGFSPSAQLAYVYWVTTARTEETRQARIKKTIERLLMKKKFGDV